MSYRRVLVCLAAASFALPACNTVRTLPRVKEVGDRHYRDHKWEAARAEYQEYVDRKPGEAEVQMKLARCLVELGRPGEAVTNAAVAYDARPNNPEALETYCLALAEAKRTDELFRILNGNCETRGSVEDYDRQGRFLFKLGDADSAYRSFKMAAQVDGGRTIEPQLVLANFHRDIGDKTNEAKRLRMAMYFDPTNQEIYDRLRGLGQIPGPSLKLTPEELNATATGTDR
jgi:tetratricopeptide (TPR) repeat protein